MPAHTPEDERAIAGIRSQLKELFVSNMGLEDITPEEIGDNEPIFGEEGLGLDSLDAVEIIVLVQRNFGVALKDAEKRTDMFTSIDSLARYIHETKAGAGQQPPPADPA